MLCKRCNNLIPDDSVFCRYCGEKVSLEIPSANNTVATEYVPPKKKSHKVLIISCVTCIALLIVLLVGGGIFGAAILSDPSKYMATVTQAREETIKQTVKQIKSTEKLPRELDEVTTWVDVTAQPDAIRYHYVLDNLDTSQLSNESLKDFLLSVVCNNQASDVLKLNINMEYSYTVKGSQQKYFVVLTKEDCGF